MDPRRAAVNVVAIAALLGAGFTEIAPAVAPTPAASPTPAATPPSAVAAAPTLGPTAPFTGAPELVADATQPSVTASPATTSAAASPSADMGPTTPLWVTAPDPVAVVTNTAPLPGCRYGEAPTPLARLADWSLTLVDTTYKLPNEYVPDDLVSTATAGLQGGFYVRGLVAPDLGAMASAAAAAGAPLAISSAYRDYLTQGYAFNNWVNTVGYAVALLYSARSGHSEHQLGTVIDFMDRSGQQPWIYYNFATESRAGAWLAANAWRYGFVMSYPRGKTAVTCYAYEPWHYRYVGLPQAAAIHASGLTLREWLWSRQPAPPPSSPPPPADSTPSG
jgi:D-alanyl-D-alanine carboxypeptidase